VQRFDVVAKVTVLFSTLTTGLTVLLLSLGYGLRSVVTLNALVPLAALVLYLVIDARIVPEFRPVPRWDRALLARLFSFGGYALVTTLGGALLFHFDKFALGSLAGVALVTFYVVPGALAQKIHSAASQLGVVVFPAASDLLARGELERVRRLYVRATRFIVLFLLSVSIPPLLLAHDLLLHWLGRDFAEKSTSVLVILIATYFVIGLTAVPYFVVLGAGKPKVGAAFSAVPALINVVLVFVLIPPFELTGAATAYLLSTVPVPFFVRYVERRILQLDTRFWLALLVRVLPASAAQAGVCLLLSPLVTGLGTLIAVLAAALPVLVVVYYLLGFFDQGDRELIHQLVPPLGRLSRA
jgi:O-antigen/teichoic acid export membrane protein